MIEYKVLIVDDEDEIRDAIEIYLKNEGITVFKAKDGIDALMLLEEQEVHLIIMDIMMPKMDGIKTTFKIRKNKNIPIIMLSAKSEDTDKILGLNIGADDYITKPFNMLELVARVKSQLRRYVNLGNYKETEDKVVAGSLILDKKRKIVSVDEKSVRLTPIEYKILELLIENKGRVFSIEQIYEKAWKEPYYNGENTVAVHIRRIREKIEINPREPRYLKVVWGGLVTKSKNKFIYIICFIVGIYMISLSVLTGYDLIKNRQCLVKDAYFSSTEFDEEIQSYCNNLYNFHVTYKNFDQKVAENRVTKEEISTLKSFYENNILNSQITIRDEYNNFLSEAGGQSGDKNKLAKLTQQRDEKLKEVEKENTKTEAELKKEIALWSYNDYKNIKKALESRREIKYYIINKGTKEVYTNLKPKTNLDNYIKITLFIL